MDAVALEDLDADVRAEIRLIARVLGGVSVFDPVRRVWRPVRP